MLAAAAVVRRQQLQQQLDLLIDDVAANVVEGVAGGFARDVALGSRVEAAVWVLENEAKG